jgi:hypothetical protein
MSVEKLLANRKLVVVDPISQLSEKVSQITTSRSFNDENIGRLTISTESLGTNEEQLLTNVYNNFESSIKAISSDFGISLESYQLEAGTIAGMIATNPKLTLGSKLKSVDSDVTVVIPNITDGYMERPQIATEAYDERDNRNAQTYSIIYNLLASRQDDFGETFFPTIVVNPNEVGVALSAKLFYVYNDFKRSVTGSLAQYARKDVIRAYADAEILKNELTRAIPVLRSGTGADNNEDKFVPVATVPSWSVSLGNNITVQTGALKVDTKLDLIGLSQTNELLNSGIMGPSDTLDTFIRLENIFVKVTSGTNTSIIRVSAENIPTATFTYAPQGNYRRMLLALDSDSIVLDSTTKDISGNEPDALPELSNHKARVQITISGNVSLDKGDCIVNRGSMSLVTLRDNNNNLITGGHTLNDLTTKIASAEILGYTLVAYRANSNIRQRGQLLDSQIEYRIVPVPYRSPLSVIMPAINATGDDNSALQTLITATGIRVSNEAVSSLLKAQVSLNSYKLVADANGNLPEISTIGHFYVKPTYFSETVDLALTVDSLKSHERLKDIRAALVEKIRYYASAMYRDSEYKSAALVLTGNTGFKPTVIVGTDPVICNYIMADGDLRTLGDTFDVRVVSTLDTRVSGKIFISFGVFDSSRNTSINPLNFGNMLWSPELTVVMPVSRDGQVSKELIVAPRFLHNVNLPVMTVLTVSGLPNVTGKVTVNMNEV